MKQRSRAFFRNPAAVAALAVLLAVILFCIFYPMLTDIDYRAINFAERLELPSRKHPLGTDEMGRDLMVRMAVGGRVTLSVAFLSGLIAAVSGTAVGILCGFAGGTADSVIMRLMDALGSIPGLLLAIVFDYLLGMGNGNFLWGIALAGIPPFARLVRGAVLEISGSAFVEASRALGAKPGQVVRKHVFRNVLPMAAIQATTTVASALTTCTILGYIGVGINAPTPEWGALFDNGKYVLRNLPHLSVIPGAAIVVCILCLVLLGNGIRDSLSIGGGDA